MITILQRLLLVPAVTILTAACLGQTGPTDHDFPPGTTRVLFVGNSLTYTNDLPAMVTAVAKLAGNSSIGTAVVAYPNYALEDHWAEGTARTFLGRHPWEWVVMQQGPSSLPESQVHLATWATQFAPAIRAAGAEPVLYMVWPASTRPGDFPGVLASYRNAAAGIGGVFAPAGDAWLAAWEVNSQFGLYGPDGFHPSVAGTYLAALVILERIAGIDPLQVPPTIPGSSTSEATVRILQQAARTALDRNPARPAP